MKAWKIKVSRSSVASSSDSLKSLYSSNEVTEWDEICYLEWHKTSPDANNLFGKLHSNTIRDSARNLLFMMRLVELEFPFSEQVPVVTRSRALSIEFNLSSFAFCEFSFNWMIHIRLRGFNSNEKSRNVGNTANSMLNSCRRKGKQNETTHRQDRSRLSAKVHTRDSISITTLCGLGLNEIHSPQRARRAEKCLTAAPQCVQITIWLITVLHASLNLKARRLRHQNILRFSLFCMNESSRRRLCVQVSNIW